MDPGPVILIVDDSPIIRKFTKCVLGNTFQDSKIDVASNASDGLVLMQSCSYDVVVMDVFMPGISGFDATKRFRGYEKEANLSHRRRTKIVGMSSILDACIQDAAEQCGMDFFTPKTSPEEFVRVIKAVLAAPSRSVPKNTSSAISSDIVILNADVLKRKRKADDLAESTSLAELIQVSQSYYFPE